MKGLRISDCRLPIADFRVAIADCRLPIADLFQFRDLQRRRPMEPGVVRATPQAADG